VLTALFVIGEGLRRCESIIEILDIVGRALGLW
jgi:hypothetical protein